MKKTELFRKSAGKAVVSYGSAGFLSCADALEFACSMRDSTADIVFLDPPFNLGKNYGLRSLIEEADEIQYEWYMVRLLNELCRVLKPGGALFLYHLPIWAVKLSAALRERLEFRHWIAIAMKNGFVRGRRLYPAHYALLYYTKGNPRHFHRPRLAPQLCRHCGEFVKDYGGYTPIITRKGINLSDFWDDLSPVRHAATKRREANQLPLLLTNRVVQIAGVQGGLLVDPFAGTGTSLLSARQFGMSFVGNDLSRESIRICVDRLGEPRRTG